jgi:hypothetical protein
MGKLEFDSLSKIREDEGRTWSRGGNGARERTGSVPDSEGLVRAGSVPDSRGDLVRGYCVIKSVRGGLFAPARARFRSKTPPNSQNLECTWGNGGI